MSVLTPEMREKIKGFISHYPRKQAVTLPALHIVQDEMRCVPRDAIKEIAQMLDLHPSEVHDTLSFYGFFRPETDKLGTHRVWICRSISCMLRGGEDLLNDLCHELHLAPGQKSADGKITLEFAECLGACEGAPCALVDDECHMNLDVEKAKKLIASLPGKAKTS